MNSILSTIAGIALVILSPLTAFFQGGVASKQDVQQSRLTPEMAQIIEQYVSESSARLGASTQPIAGQTYNLAGSGISSSATSITLQSFTIKQTGYKIQDSELSDTFHITIDPGVSSKQEIVSCTTSTQNANGTATFTGCIRGLLPIAPYTASSTMRFTHAGSAQVIFSDPPQLFNLYTAKANNESITGEWTYSINPHATTATSSDQLVTLGQVNGIAIQGAATSTESVGGIVRLGTLAQQAASYNNGVADPTVLQTKNATSTCQVVGSYTIVASSTTGKLDKNCLDGSLNYTWSGTNLFTASTTHSATTTISASNALNNALVLNSIAYAFPSTQGATKSKLENNGSGTLTWVTGNNQINFASTTDVVVSGNYATSTAVTIPAGYLTASSTLNFKASVLASVTTQTGVSCDFSLRESTGATYFSTTIDVSSAGSTETAEASIIASIFSNNSTSSQISTGIRAKAPGSASTAANIGPIENTSSIDWSAARSFVFVADATDVGTTCTIHSFSINIIP